MKCSDLQPIVVYGSSISYFSGKLENYFRLRGIPYELRGIQYPQDEKRIKAELGLCQMPSVSLGDGRWMTDTTEIIRWFEREYPGDNVIPDDPELAFYCYLLEDWADEWWWRPAMHYRWYYPKGAYLQSRHLADELTGSIPAPGFARRWMLRRRQRSGYTTGDGISAAAVPGVEAMYLRLLAQLEVIFSQRPFLLGDRPSLADVGLSGPFFRHFALDPVPLELIRERAPSVLEWVARLWNTSMAECPGELPGQLPEDLLPLLQDIGESYLPYLNANVQAVAAGKKCFDISVGGVDYRNARYSRYRVWCLQQLRSHFEKLPEAAQQSCRNTLEQTGCWQPLWQEQSLPLLPGQEEGLPFRADYKMLGVNE